LKHLNPNHRLLSMFNENQVIEKVLQGDMRAFDLLVKQYEKLVCYVIYRMIKNKEDMEDVCQDVFIKVYRNLSQFDHRAKLSTWIAKIAYLTAVSHLKKNRQNTAFNYPDDLDEIHFTDEHPEKLLTRKDTAEYLERMIAQLPEKYRMVITLYHLKEFSYTEIGEITGLPEGTVKTHLFRARQLLKETLTAN